VGKEILKRFFGGSRLGCLRCFWFVDFWFVDFWFVDFWFVDFWFVDFWFLDFWFLDFWGWGWGVGGGRLGRFGFVALEHCC
jgi:hypothetical protein